MDFVTVMNIDGDVRSIQRLTDLPEGLLGVRIERRNRTDLVISAEQPGAYTVDGQAFTGQVVVLRLGDRAAPATGQPAPTDPADDTGEADKEIDAPPATPQPSAPSDDDRAKSLVQLAKMYHEQGMVDEAIAKLETCLGKYPDAAATEEAKALLRKWR